ncbi:MAG: glycosyltransferase family 1 protein [Betaproteobacteria bacterium]|nr:MAG: glycosyltransferase family 1 protein [Betaproteobacteria bacterium]
MKIAIVTLGTRGDVQPFVALGNALKARGHDVVIGAPENFRTWIECHGLRYRSIGVDMQSFVQSIDARKVMAGNVLAMVRMWRREIVPLTRNSLDAIWETARNADVIVYHPKTAGATDVAEVTGAGLVHAAPLPIFPTKSFPLLVLRGNYGPWLNRLSYRFLTVPQLLLRSTVNRWRKEVLGLGKGPLFAASSTRRPVQLCAVSPSVVPDYPADDTENICTTGYWFLDESSDWRPDPTLAAFLEQGDPPVYIGFGSMTSVNPARLGEIIVEGVHQARVRAIVASGWGAVELIDAPGIIHTIDEAPHGPLFKHVSAVVHHGGAGTTAAGLRAGLPTLVCPLSIDQPFWGRRVYSLGCGPKPQPLKRLHAEKFAQALIELTQTESFRTRSSNLAKAIAKEDGLARAVEVVETFNR